MKTHITPKFVKDFKGYATKFENPDWDMYDTAFSEYLIAIDNIASCMHTPEFLNNKEKEVYEKDKIEIAIDYIEDVARSGYTGHTISFENDERISRVNCTPENFAQAIQYVLYQKGRMLDFDRLDDAKTGKLDRVPIQKCDPITEQRMVSIAVNKMNEYLEEHPEVMPENGFFNIGEYLDNSNVSTR